MKILFDAFRKSSIDTSRIDIDFDSRINKTFKTNVCGLIKQEWWGRSMAGWIFLYQDGFDVSVTIRLKNRIGNQNQCFLNLSSANKWRAMALNNPRYLSVSEVKSYERALNPLNTSNERFEQIVRALVANNGINNRIKLKVVKRDSDK